MKYETINSLNRNQGIGSKLVEAVRQDIAEIIGIDLCSIKSNVSYTVLETVQEDGYVRKKIMEDTMMGNNFGKVVVVSHGHALRSGLL